MIKRLLGMFITCAVVVAMFIFNYEARSKYDYKAKRRLL